jgi:hypothetical protein
MSEPGERRRRRELERASEGGAPDAALATGSATPQSRRALRSQPVASVGPDGQSGGVTPYQVPGMAPESSQAMRSRRAIRTTTPLEPMSPRPTTTGPPPVRSANTGSRAPSAWDASPVAQPVASRPAVPRPAVVSPSAPQPSAAPEPPNGFPRADLRPTSPAQVSPPVQQQATGQASSQPTGFQPRPSAWSGPAGTAGPLPSSRYGAPSGAPVAPSGDWPPTSGRTVPSWAPGAGALAPAAPVEVIAAPVDAIAAAPVVGSWGSSAEPAVGTKDVDEASVPPWSSLGIAATGSAPAGPTDREVSPIGASKPYGDDDEDEDRPSHPYTWLQLIVLALVAFVLGFLIMLLASHGSGAAASPAPQPGAIAQVDASSSTMV